MAYQTWNVWKSRMKYKLNRNFGFWKKDLNVLDILALHITSFALIEDNPVERLWERTHPKTLTLLKYFVI